MRLGELYSLNYMYINQMQQAKQAILASSKRLSTGKNINQASDNPSMMLRISKLESEIRGRRVAEGNIEDGITFLQIKDNALSSAEEIGLALRDLASKYNNDTLSTDEKKSIEAEAKKLTKELNYLFKNTNYNSKNVFESGPLAIQAGPSGKDSVLINHTQLKGINASGDKDGNKVNNQTASPLAKKLNVSPMEADTNGTPVELIENKYKIVMDRDKKLIDLHGEVVSTVVGDVNYHTFKFKSGVYNFEGTLTISEDGTGFFQVSHKNAVAERIIEGEIYFGENSDPSNLVGDYRYKITKEHYKGNVIDNEKEFNNKFGTISFALTEQRKETIYVEDDGSLPTPNPTPTPTPTPDDSPPVGEDDFPFDDLESINPDVLLNVDFIDDKILSPLAKERSLVGTEQTILKHRLSFNNKQNVILSENMSRIMDVDVAKEMLEKAKHEMLLEVNATLLQESLMKNRNLIYQLLQ